MSYTKAIPIKDYYLCEMSNEEEHFTDNSGIYFKVEELPEYIIVEYSKELENPKYSVGDRIICRSTGTKLQLNDKVQYLFNDEDIIGKV